MKILNCRNHSQGRFLEIFIRVGGEGGLQHFKFADILGVVPMIEEYRLKCLYIV